MSRKSFSFVTFLFLALFAFALHTPAQAATPPGVYLGGGFLRSDNTYVATYISSARRLVSLTTKESHIYGYLDADSITFLSANKVSLTLDVTDDGIPATLNGLVVFDPDTKIWTVSFTVTVTVGDLEITLEDFAPATLKGGALIVLP